MKHHFLGIGSWCAAVVLILSGATSCGDVNPSSSSTGAVKLALHNGVCPSGMNVIRGTSGNDVLTGTKRADCILGLGGNDVIFGLQGDDLLVGGSGNDTIRGGQGRDTLNGGPGRDTLDGAQGRDTLNGGPGRDTLNGGRGIDSLRGGDQADVLAGGPGDDVMFGGSGPDILIGGPGADEGYGGPGADQLIGGGGQDQLRGGTGRDRIRGDRGADELFGGDGNDWILADSAQDFVQGGSGKDRCDGSSCEFPESEISECETSLDCGAGVECVLPVGFCQTTEVCPSGQPLCEVDECTDGVDNCSDNATCTDTPEGFDCACESGYRGDGVSCAPLSTVNGRITLPDGTVLSDVEILAVGPEELSAQSALGLFSLELLANTEYVLQLSGVGLADQVVPVMAPAGGGAIGLNVTMLERGGVQTFVAGTGELSGADGAAVDLDGVSWVDARGDSVTGAITVTITPVDVSNGAELDAFPGEFSGIATDESTDGPIVSYGTVEFEFSQNGEPVQPAPGQMVDIQIPIYFDSDQDGNPFAGGETIPLWSLNEDTGIWEQEGVGTVVPSVESPSGWALSAAVSHFSWWNCDVSMNAAQARVTVIGDAGCTAVVQATTDAAIGWRPNTVETVVTVGSQSGVLFVPSTGEVCFSAAVTCDELTAATTELCFSPAAGSTFDVELLVPQPGPLAITASEVVVDGFAGFPVTRSLVYPTTLEEAVTYSIVVGSLPPGLNLTQVSPTRAEVAGVATLAGTYSVTIQGDDGTETASVVVEYEISSDEPAPILLNNFISVFPQDGDSVDLNQYLDLVNGGTAALWALREDEGGPVPAGVTLDPASGILTLSGVAAERGWFGRVEVSNASGSDEAFLDVCVECIGFE